MTYNMLMGRLKQLTHLLCAGTGGDGDEICRPGWGIRVICVLVQLSIVTLTSSIFYLSK